MCSLAKDIGIDLGTASVLIYVKDKGIVLNEPSVVAIDKDTGKLLKVGADAQAMLGRTPGNIVAIRPLREGVISDYEVTERMLKELIHKVMGFQFFKPRIIICVPSGITEVEERAVIDAGIQAGARRVYLIEEPVAAAIGAGIDITQPDGHFIIDIGGGTSDIAVISLSGVVESASIKVAGDQFNEAVVKYMRRKHNLLIGERTAEEMKMSIGCVFPPEEEMTMDITAAMSRDAGVPLRELKVDGGASRNNLLMQFQADILGTKVIRPQVVETTAMGAAYLAGLAVGYWSSIDEIRKQWQVDRVFEPSWDEKQIQTARSGWEDAVKRTLSEYTK